MSGIKCLVCVKQVIDFNVKIRVKQDNSGVETDNVKLSMNPFDEIAVEEAVRQKEAGHISEIVVVSIGPSQAQEVLRLGLARGADRAILIETPDKWEPISIAKILKQVIQEENPQLVLLGKQAIDDDCNQTGQMLAALLDWPQATFASQLSLDIAQKTITVTREVDGGLETLALDLPAMVTTDLRLNEPRYLSLPNVMRAKSKPLQVRALSALNLTLKKHTRSLSTRAPEMQRKNIVLANAADLVQKLRFEDKVI